MKRETQFNYPLEKVIEAVEGEILYQRGKFGQPTKTYSPAMYVILMKRYHRQAMTKVSQEDAWVGALTEIRKVAALAVSCGEFYGFGVFGTTRLANRGAAYGWVQVEASRSEYVYTDLGYTLAEIGWLIRKAERSVRDPNATGRTLDFVGKAAAWCLGCLACHGVPLREVVEG